MLAFLAALSAALPLPAAPQDAQAVVTANNQFALDLYHQVRGKDDNLFFSPYSITKALAMTYAGASGETAREMAAVLHFDLGQDRQHQAFLELRKQLNHNQNAVGFANPFQAKRGVQLLLSANVWGQRGYGFQDSYRKLLQECYGAGLQEVDFAASEAARKTINSWVDQQTQHKIQNLFQQGAINSNTRLVLATAVYFKGDWVSRFKKDRTTNQPFHLDASHKVQVPLMSQTETFGYFEDEQMQGLQMPYEGKEWALLVLLPKQIEGLRQLEKNLTAEKLDNCCSQLRDQEVKVYLPKLKLNAEMELQDTLTALGMKKAFVGGEADFSRMNGGRESLYVSTVTHKAFADVNEEGTEAAAATGIAVAALSAPNFQPMTPVFRADHPFVFAIRNVRTGVVMFLGRVVKP